MTRMKCLTKRMAHWTFFLRGCYDVLYRNFFFKLLLREGFCGARFSNGRADSFEPNALDKKKLIYLYLSFFFSEDFTRMSIFILFWIRQKSLRHINTFPNLQLQFHALHACRTSDLTCAPWSEDKLIAAGVLSHSFDYFANISRRRLVSTTTLIPICLLLPQTYH